VWTTKYRYKTLTKAVGIRIREIIRQFCDGNDIQIIKGRVSKGHIHLYISYPPKWSISDLVKHIKGRSSKKIQEEFPELDKVYWGRHFWGIGYGSFSSGHVTDEMIQEYLEKHGKGGNHNDEDFEVE